MPAPCPFCSDFPATLEGCPTCDGTGHVPDSFKPDRDFVISCLHWDGERHHLIPAKVAWQAYVACDGFGPLSGEELSSINGGWDWSHVRDSTPRGIAAAAELLRTHMNEFGGL